MGKTIQKSTAFPFFPTHFVSYAVVCELEKVAFMA